MAEMIYPHKLKKMTTYRLEKGICSKQRCAINALWLPYVVYKYNV